MRANLLIKPEWISKTSAWGSESIPASTFWFNPRRAFYLFPKVSALYGKEFGGRTINDSLDFCDYILNTALVSLVPGVAFGMDEHVRISYASSEEELREAMTRIKAALT